MSGCDILSISWESESRDTNIVEPVLCYLEKYKGIKKIRRESFANYLWKLIIYKPKMLVMANHTGSLQATLVTKYANALGIKTVSLISEGNPASDSVAEEFFWGWNKKKEKIVDLFIIWSKRSEEMFLRMVPEAKNYNLVVSGGTGFDRYKLLRFMSKEDFLKKYKRKEKMVVGIAGWGFEVIRRGVNLPYTDEEIAYLLATEKRLNEVYDLFISNHPDVLFILKYHPETGPQYHTEFDNLNKYTNVMEFVCEEGIDDLISVCDIWMTFESTTLLEAWLLDKETLFINPTGGYFHRSSIVEGSMEIKSSEELENVFTEYLVNNVIDTRGEVLELRCKIIEDIIQYDDGKNYIRAAEPISDLFFKGKKKKSIDKAILYEMGVELVKEIKRNIIDGFPMRYFCRLGMDMYLKRKLFNKKARECEREKYMKAI